MSVKESSGLEQEQSFEQITNEVTLSHIPQSSGLKTDSKSTKYETWLLQIHRTNDFSFELCGTFFFSIWSFI